MLIAAINSHDIAYFTKIVEVTKIREKNLHNLESCMHLLQLENKGGTESGIKETKSSGVQIK